MPNTRVSRKSQVTLPASMRRQAGIELGDEVKLTVEEGRIVISKAEPLAWLQRMEAFRGDHWNGAADELRRDRDAWDLPT